MSVFFFRARERLTNADKYIGKQLSQAFCYNIETRFIVRGFAAAYPNMGIRIEGTFLNFNMGCIDNP